MKYVFVINPVAGKNTKQEIFASEVKKYFEENGGTYEIYFTKHQGDALRYSRELAMSGEEIRIFACGGEGTAFEVLNGIVGYDNVSIGVVPCGSANDFIKYFSNKEVFLDVPSQVEGETVEIDIIKVQDKYAINSCSIGMDAMVAANMSKFKNLPFVNGDMAYVFSLVYTLFSKLGVNLKVIVDNGKKAIERKSLFAVIANAPFYGGGFNPTPSAIPFDGRLDFSVVSVVPSLRILSLLKKYRAGTHIYEPICEFGVCEKVIIKAEKTVPLNMDGEIFFTDYAEFEILKKAVKLIIPKTISKDWKKKAGQIPQEVTA